MNDESGNIEKLLERYALGELSGEDRRLVEQYLTSPGEDAARARQDLRFEQTLLRALSAEVPSHDVAGAVLDRVFRRPELEHRRRYRPDLAATILHQAREEGRIGPPRQRLLTPRVRRFAGIAAGIGFLAFLLWSTTIDPQRQRRDQGRTYADVDLGLVGDVAVMPCAVDAVFTGIPEAPRGKIGRPLRVGDEITTDAEEIAVLRVDEGQGRVALLPLSRVRIVRSGPGSPLTLRVLEGGFHYDFSGLSGSVPVETDKGHRGKIQGKGEMMIATRSLGTAQPALESSLGQIILVRVDGKSWAQFESPEGAVRISRGQLGIVGPESAMAVSESSLADIAPNLSALWKVDSFLPGAAEPAMELPGASLSRADLVSEALRVYKYDLIELLAVSFVVDTELDRLGVSPSQTDNLDASNFVRNDELMQVLPLRAEDAVQARCRQIAGLLAIDRERQRRKGGELRSEPVALVRQRLWPQLARGLSVRRGGDDETIAFEFGYRGKTMTVERAVAWAKLRQFMRVSEMDRLMRHQSEKSLLSVWLEKRGERWHDEAPTFPPQFVAMAQMTGLSRVMLEDSIRIAQLIQSVVQPPSRPEIERFMRENVSKRRPLVFDHWFFPTTDPFRGYELDRGRAETARADAVRLVAELRAGKTPEVVPAAPRFQGSIWKNGIAGGPRPWWNEVFGRDFGLAVSNLASGQVSEPIRSPEGWHVVRLLQEGPEQSDPRAHRSYAIQLYRHEMARRIFDGIVAKESKRLVEPVNLLR